MVTEVIRKILVPVRGDGKGDNVLAHAAAMARRFNAHIKITHCRARPEDMMPYGVPIPAFLKKQLLEQAAGLADLEEQGLQQEVEVLAEKFNLTLSDEPTSGSATASWVEEPGRQVDIIKRHGRLADMIFVAKPDVSRNLGTNTLKAALFHTGRPVVMCPPVQQAPLELGESIAIAWNGSVEASRAVALTLPLATNASRVIILSSGTDVHGASTADLVEYLGLRNIIAEEKRFEVQESIGTDLLKHASGAGADLLVMGAYGNSHEAETVLGGNTQAVVDNAQMPVVFVH